MLGSMKRSEAYAWLLALASSSTFPHGASQLGGIGSLPTASHAVRIVTFGDSTTATARDWAPDVYKRQAGCFAITGASTLPALSSAVVDDLKQSLAQLRVIDIVIAPGQRAPRGAATVAGVLGYAGQPFLWWREGSWRSAYGWQELQRAHLSFGSRWAAACDVPDLALLPARYPGVQTVSFRAALEVSLQHYALWLLAQCRRMGLSLPTARWGCLLYTSRCV